MKKVFFLFAALTFLSTQLSAQQNWLWGKRGGGGANDNGAINESVIDAAVDANGNVYTLSNLLFDQFNVDVDGHALTGKRTSVVLNSFTCTGAYRWSKVLGSNTDDIAASMRIDTLGGVYVSGVTNGVNFYDSTYFSTDTSFGQRYKTMFLVKYDTGGNYKWLRQPQPDTAGFWTITQPNGTFDMDVDKSGNVYMMGYLSRANALGI